MSDDLCIGGRTGADPVVPVRFDGADLTTHGVIVGMTGWGKTGFAVTLLEEGLARIPVIALDPKGDLGEPGTALSRAGTGAVRPVVLGRLITWMRARRPRPEISGLDARQFILHSAHLAAPVELTSRWTMSYLAGPLTAEQLRALAADYPPPSPRTTALRATRLATSDTAFDADAATAGGSPGATPASDRPTTRVPGDATLVMPPVAEGTPVRWLDPAAPWGDQVGVAPDGPVCEAAVVARVALRYDDRTAGVDHRQEWKPCGSPSTSGSIRRMRCPSTSTIATCVRTHPTGWATASPTRRSTPRGGSHRRRRPRRPPAAGAAGDHPAQPRAPAVRTGRRDT